MLPAQDPGARESTMSQLILIRHGQAAAFTADSDRLTELGRRQAEKLAEHFLRHGLRFDEVHSGTLNRQVESERIVGAAYERAGIAWPEARRASGWNEYDAGAIVGKLAPLLAERDARFASLMNDFRANSESKDRNRYFQRMLETVMEHWVAGTLVADGVESFAAFHARVSAARNAILDTDGSRTVAVFTSGGPIGACVQLATEAPPRMAVHLNWRVKNGSLTEFVFSSSKRLSLDCFNACPHLTTADLHSFR
jgi:broad specificity phosphatase PhoE